MKVSRLVLLVSGILAAAVPALADPCGMVPPLFVSSVMPIQRIGVQKTYVFYKSGIETFVIRPGYKGEVDNFGMLIPFPNPPAIRKVPDNIFAHVAAAIDPPEVTVDLRWAYRFDRALKSSRAIPESMASDRRLEFDEVVVLNQEAVGMYEVAVLQAGSAAALDKWMSDHGFQYPDGMDAVCEEYVEAEWCFVAVKTRVGNKAGVDPRPGQRSIDSSLPAGATFDGHVQAMGFRFRTDEFVLPMRLAAFNEGDLRNVVYILSERGMRINNIPKKYVVRQVSGRRIERNLTRKLPLRVIGGSIDNIPEWRQQSLDVERDPTPHNGLALDLFASDLQTLRSGNLAHEFEEKEKELLNIGERLGLRGPELDAYHKTALAELRDEQIRGALNDLKRMTLTVIDGDFSRDVIARENLSFSRYKMASSRNKPTSYDARLFGPRPEQDGYLYDTGSLDPGELPRLLWPFAGVLLLGITLVRRRASDTGQARSSRKTTSIIDIAVALAVVGFAWPVSAGDSVHGLIGQLGDPEEASQAVDALAGIGTDAIDPLLDVARDSNDMATRGWAIVTLTEIGGDKVSRGLERIYVDRNESILVRTWAAAARIQLARNADELVGLSRWTSELPATGRPMAERFVETLSDGEPASLESLLAMSMTVPNTVQAALRAPILNAGPDPLVDIMVNSGDMNVRRQATAYLATLGARDNEAVASAVIDAYWFDANVEAVPWQGGPLYIPGIAWAKPDARALVDNLIRWLLFCELNALSSEEQQIQNNLRSLGLAQAAGYQFSGSNDPAGWFRTYGKAAGKWELEKIFREQGVAGQTRYEKILKSL